MTVGRRRLPLRRCRASRGSRRSRPGSSTSTSPIRRDGPRASRRGSARSRTRSSSAAGRSTTSTRTFARPAPADARASSARSQVKGSSTTPGKASRRRARPRRRDVAPVPADPRKRPRAHRSLHLGGQMKLLLSFALAVVGSARRDAAAASAHAHVSPSIVPAAESQVFTLAVPTEKEDASTTSVELTPPGGLLDRLVHPVAGLEARRRSKTGEGEDAVITKITWTGGDVPPARPPGSRSSAAPTRARRTRSASGRRTPTARSSTGTGPRARIRRRRRSRRRASFGGGGGGSDTLAIVALIVGAIARRARDRRPRDGNGETLTGLRRRVRRRFGRGPGSARAAGRGLGARGAAQHGPVAERHGEHAAEGGQAHVLARRSSRASRSSR